MLAELGHARVVKELVFLSKLRFFLVDLILTSNRLSDTDVSGRFMDWLRR
jgi:hypothetical protein